MRVAVTVAALAAGALAIPFKRDVVTDVNVVFVTDVVTVTAGQPIPSAEAKVKHAHHHLHHHHAAASVEVSTTIEAAAATPSAFTPPQPPSVTAAPSSEAPAPVFQAPSIQAPSAPVPSAPAPVANSFQEIVLAQHNIHRQNHSAPPLQWDEGLAASAQTIAASCVYAHNTEVDGGGYGQNIAAGVDSTGIASVITDMFYNNEEPYFASQYGQANPDMSGFESWGHFTQIVWKDTTHVACATQYCSGGLANTGGGVSPYFTVCNYKNPGNYDGEYAANVMAPIGMASVTAGM